MNCPFPVSSLWSSKRLTGWPAPKRILPGRMFISLSFELLVGLSGVLAAFLPETTHSIRCNKCATRRAHSTWSWVRFCCKASRFSAGPLPEIAQRGLDHLALLGRQGSLRRDGIADRVTLNVEAGLDAGGQVEAGKGLVDAPQPALQRHRLIPARRLAEIVEFDALPRDDAGGTSHPAQPA